MLCEGKKTRRNEEMNTLDQDGNDWRICENTPLLMVFSVDLVRFLTILETGADGAVSGILGGEETIDTIRWGFIGDTCGLLARSLMDISISAACSGLSGGEATASTDESDECVFIIRAKRTR
jgi:hypothetical protein